MSAKRVTAPGKVALLALRAAKLLRAIIVLLATSLLAAGCATTSSQNAQYKPHKPQMITSEGVEEVGAFKLPYPLDHGFPLSDGWADFLSSIGGLFANSRGLP